MHRASPPPALTESAGKGRYARILVWGGESRKMEDGAGKRKSAKRQKEKSKSGGGKKHGRKTVFWLGASVFSFLATIPTLAPWTPTPTSAHSPLHRPPLPRSLPQPPLPTTPPQLTIPTLAPWAPVPTFANASPSSTCAYSHPPLSPPVLVQHVPSSTTAPTTACAAHAPSSTGDSIYSIGSICGSSRRSSRWSSSRWSSSRRRRR